jgi:hypothetical protein
MRVLSQFSIPHQNLLHTKSHSKRKVDVGKGETKRARMIFKSAKKSHFLRVGDDEKCCVDVRGDDGKE